MVDLSLMVPYVVVGIAVRSSMEDVHDWEDRKRKLRQFYMEQFGSLDKQLRLYAAGTLKSQSLCLYTCHTHTPAHIYTCAHAIVPCTAFCFATVH